MTDGSRPFRGATPARPEDRVRLGQNERVTVWTIVVAAGGGTRFGGAKQFAALGDRSVLDRSVATALQASAGVVVVLPAGAHWSGPPGVLSATGGATRAASVRAGLDRVPADADVVLVHDAARPLASVALFRAVVRAVQAGADAVVPALAVADTLKRVRDGVVVATVDRSDLVAVQTPQGFRAPVLRSAHAGAPDATDDAGLVEAAGGRVVVVPGEAANTKITEPADLERAVALLSARAGEDD